MKFGVIKTQTRWRVRDNVRGNSRDTDECVKQDSVNKDRQPTKIITIKVLIIVMLVIKESLLYRMTTSMTACKSLLVF